MNSEAHLPESRVRTDEVQIFSRLISVPEIGQKGLKKLRLSKVAVVGVGGVGSAAAEYLARSGIGVLKLVDQDIVERSNLPRIHQADVTDVYFPKAEVVAKKLSQRFPWIQTEPIIDTLQTSNVEELLGGVDIILDGLDNFRTRLIINRFSARSQTPYVFTSAIGTQGHLALLKPPETACLECTFRETSDRMEESCEVLGVTSTIVGVVGCMAANETISFLSHNDSGLEGKLLTIDLAGPEFLVTRMTRRADCPSCTSSQRITADGGRSWDLCGERAVNLLPEKGYDLDLFSVANRVPNGERLANSKSVLVFRRGSLVVSLFRNGRLIIHGLENSSQAVDVAQELWNEFAT